MFAARRIRLEKDVILRIQRHLPGKGTINVSEGAEVSPDDIIGTSEILSGFRIIRMTDMLGVIPTEVSKYLKRQVGDRIFKGELLAEKTEGLLGKKKIVVAPEDGILEFLNPQTGELRFTFMPKKTNLPAGVFGIVESVDKIKGKVIIKTQSSIIYGMFGTGRTRDGILQIIGKRDQLIDKSFISTDLDGKIIVGGSLMFKDTISASISDRISGIITGGINAKDYKAMAGGRLVFPKKLETEIGISIVVCEGFGSVPIGKDIYDYLLSANGKFTIVDGNAGRIFLPSFKGSSIDKIKKTVLPPIQKDLLFIYEKYQEQVPLKKGLKVRIIGNSYLGEQGQIVSLDKTETKLQSGIKTQMATIETQRRKLQVPVANLEVIDYSF